MLYLYYLRSISYPDRTYIGFTSNMKQRFAHHNDGRSIYTKDFTPWKVIGFFEFDQELKAI